MANFFNTPLSTFIRGAQTTIHEWQMMLQSLKQTVIAGLIIVALLAGWQVYNKTSEHDRYVIQRWFTAGTKAAFFGPESAIDFVDKNGKTYKLYTGKYLRSTMAKKVWLKAGRASLVGVKVGSALSSLILLLVLLFFYLNGRRQGRDFHVRGAQLGTTGDLAGALKKVGRRGTISLGGIRLPAEMEPTNIAMIGAPRTGKSVQISAILEEVRAAGQRAIVYDYGGLFTRLFYREGIDTILNPMDERSAEWRPWYDAYEPAHFEQQAVSLIPDDKSIEDFWPKAARTVYVALTRKIATLVDNPDLSDLLFWGLQQNANEVAKFLAGTEATSAFGQDKTSASIMSHLATYLKAFNYLRTSGTPFSIRQWIAGENDDSWLFISTNEAHIDTVRPLISLWVDIAVSAILSLPENLDRRIWYAVDELTSMQAVPSLAKALTHAPKYGGCGLIGYQSKPILEKIYDDRTAAALSGGCAIHCIYRANDVETAEWAERALGKTEVAETNEGISYGVTQLRDGRTANINRTLRPLILASEIRALEKFQYFLSMGSGLPTVPVQLSYKPRPEIAAAYIPHVSQQLVIEQTAERFPTDTSVPLTNEPNDPQCGQQTAPHQPPGPASASGELALEGGSGKKPPKQHLHRRRSPQKSRSKSNTAANRLNRSSANGNNKIEFEQIFDPAIKPANASPPSAQSTSPQSAKKGEGGHPERERP